MNEVQAIEIKRLMLLLDGSGIPFDITDDICGNKNNQIWIPGREHSVCDVICHKYSFGGSMGLLELYSGRIFDHYGYLSATEAFDIINDILEEENK